MGAPALDAAMRNDSRDKIELIAVEIGDQVFCISITDVREIRGWTATTPMPQAPDYVRGVTNLRGIVMPVIDLRKRLGLGVTEATSRHVIVVVQYDGRLAGLLVDAVLETFSIETGQLQSPPIVGPASEQTFVDAIIPVEGRLLSRLVVDALLPLAASYAA